MDDSDKDMLHKFHPKLRKYITEIWKNGKIGICAGNLQIKTNSNYKYDDYSESNYFTDFILSVPFAGQFLEWHVIFSNDDLYFAPDFDFGNDDFLGDFTAETIAENIPSLAKWDPMNPKSLIQVITEFYTLYKKHQITMLEDDKFSRLHFEYSSLVSETEVNKEDVEVLVEPSGAVHFLISLSVDFTCLPSYIHKTKATGNPGPATSMLLVTFDGSFVKPQLFLSPSVEQALGGVGNKHIPPFPVEGCLMDYVPEVCKLLKDKVKSIVDNYVLKCEYISHILAQNAFSVIEYDSSTFSKATLLFENKNFYWLLIVTIGNNFPREKPRWMLRSVYHMSFGKPYMEVLDDYPYSPRWRPEEMINRAFKYTIEYIPQYQSSSIQKSHI